MWVHGTLYGTLMASVPVMGSRSTVTLRIKDEAVIKNERDDDDVTNILVNVQYIINSPDFDSKLDSDFLIVVFPFY